MATGDKIVVEFGPEAKHILKAIARDLNRSVQPMTFVQNVTDKPDISKNSSLSATEGNVVFGIIGHRWDRLDDAGFKVVRKNA